MRARRINRRRQGDLGEVSAIEWLIRQGATVSIPLGHSPDYDLIAELDGRLVRVQVKTSVVEKRVGGGREQHWIRLATSGGNRSWTGVVKRLDPRRFDYLFVLTANGRRWLIPSGAIEARTSICLGGEKYAEFEIERTAPLSPLVHCDDSTLESRPRPGEYPSGQRMAAVNRPATPSQVRILPPPSPPTTRDDLEGGTPLSREGKVWGKRRVTIPRHVFEEADLSIGDRLRFRADGIGRLIVERIQAIPY